MARSRRAEAVGVVSHRETLTVQYTWQSPKLDGKRYDTEVEARGDVPNEGRFRTLIRLFIAADGHVVRHEKIQVS